MWYDDYQLMKNFQYLKSILGLSMAIALAEFKLRNEGSYLGIFWYLLNPILSFLILTLIFSNKLAAGVDSYPLYMLLGLIMFNFFQGSTLESSNTLVEKDNTIIKSINFPMEALIGATVIKNTYSHLFEITFFIIVILFFNISIFQILYYILLIPLIF